MSLWERVKDLIEPTVRVKVKAGDSMSRIAERWTGDENRWPELSAANPGVDKDLIHPGQELNIPGEWLD